MSVWLMRSHYAFRAKATRNDKASVDGRSSATYNYSRNPQ